MIAGAPDYNFNLRIQSFNLCAVDPMIVLLSPAKSLDFESPSPVTKSTEPVMLAQSVELMKTVKQLSSGDLQSLMKISEKLGELNYERNQKWKLGNTESPFSSKDRQYLL